MIPRKKILSPKELLRRQIHETRSLLKKGIVSDNINPSFILSELKYSLTEDEVDRVLENLSDAKFNYVISNPITDSYTELSKYQDYTNRNDLKGEIRWIVRFLKDYSDEINRFLAFEKEYEKALFLGQYTHARTVVEKIESEISVSAWSMQQKFFLAELEKGFRANKDLLSSVLSKENPAIINLLAHYSSIRIEKNISPAQYEVFVNQYIDALKNPRLNDYVYFKIDFFKKLDYSDCSDILVFDGTLSIIDRYKAFIQFAQIFYSSPTLNASVYIYIQAQIAELNEIINDIDLQLLNACKTGELMSSDDQFLNVLDTYTSSNYHKAIVLSKEYLKTNPNCFPGIVIYAKSLCNTANEHSPIGEQDCLLDQIIDLSLTLFQKDQKFSQETYSNLYKIAHFLGNHPIAINIFELLSEELPSRLQQTGQINLHKFSTLNSKAPNPSLFRYVPSGKAITFVNCLKGTNVVSSTCQLIEKLSALTKSSVIEKAKLNLRELKYFALAFFHDKKDYSKALDIFNYLLSSERFKEDMRIKHIYVDLIIGKFHCLVNLGLKKAALEFATEELIKEGSFANKFLHPLFINHIAESEDPTISENICLPIFLKFYELNLDVYHIYVAYDNFLYSLGCQTPKDFFEKFDPENIKHITFLEKVCKHEVLHSSPFYKDQDELDLARIEICNFLSSTVPDFNPFESEVAELLRKVLVRKGIKQIDYSKIYVDIKGLKTNITKELRESFNRNIEIAALPVDQLNKIVDSFGNILVYYIDDAEAEAKTDDEIAEKLRLTSYNRFLHFKEAFLKIRDNFLMSSEHGLDTYLSMRIRHGTLPGQIRSVFESYNLITPFNEAEQSYLPNNEIVDRFRNLSELDKQKFIDALNKFSASIDNIAEKLKSQTIQIKTEAKNSNGLFDYSYDDKELLSLFSSKFGPLKDFDVFVDEVINELWNRTEICLATIRHHLNETFIEKIHSYFNELENTILEIDNFSNYQPAELQELFASIKDCRTAIVVEVQKISEWFKRSNKKFIEEFDFSILLGSSVNTLKGSFRNALIAIKNYSTVKLDGDLFPIFTDIIFYLFHNALKHSRVQLDELRIDVTVEQDETFITIKFKNNILDEPNYIEKLKVRIANSQNILADKKAFDRINKEGGTGFPKIKKALSQDLSRKDYLIKVGVDRDEHGVPNFVAEIQFEYSDLVKK